MKALILTGVLILICAAEPMGKTDTIEPKSNIVESCVKKPIKIAVIDTGFGFYEDSLLDKHLCQFGHKDFTGVEIYHDQIKTHDLVPADRFGHGTNIVGLIEKTIGDANINYCFVILKFNDYKKQPDFQYFQKVLPVQASINAIDYAANIGVDVINYSGGGEDFNKDETAAVKKFLDKGGIFVAAAGNERSDLKNKPYFPAMADERVLVVGSSPDGKLVSKFSNFGDRVDFWDNGENQEAYGITLQGTSQATAIRTGKVVKQLNPCAWAGQ